LADWLGIAGITTERLRLRSEEVADLPVLERTWRDPEICRYLGGPASAEDVAERRRRVGRRGKFAVVLATGEVVGFCRVTAAGSHQGCTRPGDAELAYAFLPEYWGHGYAREAAAAVLAWAFDNIRSTERIIAVTQAANTRSRRLLQALGMEQIGAEFVDIDEPAVMYAITRTPRG